LIAYRIIFYIFISYFLWILLSAILSQPSLFAIWLDDVIGYKISEVNWFYNVRLGVFYNCLAVVSHYRRAIF